MKYSELMQQWRLRCGLPAGRDECSLDYAAGIDVDDLLLNTLGGILGYLGFVILDWIRRKRDGKTS